MYSFYATKTITTGEGGMVVTDRDEVARRIRVMRLHGIDRDIWNRYTSGNASWKYDVVAPGFKYNLTDHRRRHRQGAAGPRPRPCWRSGRRSRCATARPSSRLECLLLPRAVDDHAWHLFIVRLREGALSIDRDGFIEELRQRGIGASVHFIPLHLMTYYRDTYGLRPDEFPAAMRVLRGHASACPCTRR